LLKLELKVKKQRKKKKEGMVLSYVNFRLQTSV
jgi:hypothetical protein